jgi:hypothetical protein
MNTVTDAVVACILAALLIVGGYQIYFLPQRWPLKAPRSLLISIDNKIPFWPQWAWVYSFLYYPLILSPILTIGSFRQYAYTAFNFALLLFAQVGIAYALPVKTPDHWRAYDLTATPSQRFLGLVQSIDRGGNCFPSMHVSVCTLAMLHILNNAPDMGPAWRTAVVGAFVLICLSALFTKQHYILDLPAGTALGAAVYSIHAIVFS